MPESLSTWKERGYIPCNDSIACEGCRISYSKDHYDILFKAKKLGYFFFPPPDDIPALDLLCHDCLFKNIKKYAKDEVTKLVILDEEREYICNFYPEDIDPEWNDNSDDFPFN